MQDIKQRISSLKHETLNFDHTLELGKLYLQLGDKLEARFYFKECIQNFPEEADGYYYLGKLLLDEEKWREANSYLSKALDYAPKSEKILIALASLHFHLEGYERAHSLLNKATKINENNPKIYLLLGRIAFQQNNIYNARLALTKGLKLDSEKEKGEFLYSLGVVNTQQGYYTEALDFFEKCKSETAFQEVNSFNTYKLKHNIGYCQFRSGNLGIAQEIYEKLTTTNSHTQAESFVNLAEIYWIKNNIEQAKECFEKANQLNKKAWPWMRELYKYTREGQDWLKELIDNLPKETESGPNLAMYLGCVIPNRYPYIDAASRHTLSHLGVGITDMDGAGCCPAPGVFRSFDIETWLTLGARNITIAEAQNRNLCIMCNGCYGTLNDINTELQENATKKDLVNKNLKDAGVHYEGTVDAEHIVWVLYNDIGMDKIRAKLKIPLDYKVAVHYGCHILKPIHNKPWKDSFETPTFFDDLVELTGCQSVPHRDKLMCCGAGGGLRGSEKEISLDFTRDKLEAYREAGVDIVVTCCPFCHLQLDLGQMEVNNIFKDKISAPFKFPVIYITQLLGLAMGIDPYRLGLQKTPQPKGIPPFTPVDPIFTKYFKQF